MESMEEGKIHLLSGTRAECLDTAGGKRCWDGAGASQRSPAGEVKTCWLACMKA